MTILIWINKSITANTNYRIIFSIIFGLLFSFSSQIVFAQSTSASAAADQRGATVVEMKNWEKITLAELFKREQTGEVSIITLLASRWEMKKYSEFKTQLLNQATARLDEKSRAHDLVKLAQQAMLEINRDAKNTIETPETRRINIERAKVLSNILTNPLATDWLPKRTLYIMTEVSKHLATWRNIVYIDQKVLDELKKM